MSSRPPRLLALVNRSASDSPAYAAKRRHSPLTAMPRDVEVNRSATDRQAIRSESMWRWWRMKVQRRAYRRLARRARRVHGRGPLLVAIGDSNTDPQCAYTLPRQIWLRIVGREGYKTVNLGVSGDTTSDMRRRIEHTLSEGQPEIVAVFGGANDARRGVDPAVTERNVAFMAEWLRNHDIRKVVLIGPPLMNSQPTPDWVSSPDEVRGVLREVAQRYEAVCVDLALFLRGRIGRDEDPDSARVRYVRSLPWQVEAGDPHLNAYGQRLVAEAFLEATACWRSSHGRRPP